MSGKSRSIVRMMTLVGLLAVMGGCAAVELVGGMAQNAEYQKKIEVPPMYDGLEGQTVAVLVALDHAMLYEHPYLSGQVALGLASAVQQNVPEVRVISPEQTLAWQMRNPNWSLLPYGDIAEALEVSRVLIVDIYEYRLTPPGNRYEWDGVCAATVRVIEGGEGAIDPDSPVDEFSVIARFPEDDGAFAFNTPRDRIEAGLVLKFTQRVAWLFYEHLEPKYPDKYRPELDAQ